VKNAFVAIRECFSPKGIALKPFIMSIGRCHWPSKQANIFLFSFIATKYSWSQVLLMPCSDACPVMRPIIEEPFIRRVEGGFHDKAIERLKKESRRFKVKSISFPYISS
jgi:hypothetical protein